LYPPSKIPAVGFNPADHLSDWMRFSYPKLTQEQMPVEVTQRPGQVGSIHNHASNFNMYILTYDVGIYLLCASIYISFVSW
jgi:hypothetical protein